MITSNRLRTRCVGMAAAGVVCLVHIVLRPPSQDFASGHFRAGLFRDGVYLWNNLWFGGHPLPGYGIVSPMLGGTIGVVPTAVVSVLVATWCFILVMERLWETRPELPDPLLSIVLFALGCGVNLWGGRLTFGPAVMFGTACILAVQRNRKVAAMLLAALCGLSSPLGALSLVILLGAAWVANVTSRRFLVLVSVAAVTPIGVLIVLFPEGGWFPFHLGSLVMLGVALGVVGWSARDIPMVRWFTIIYAVIAVAAFVVQSPLGGNVIRLGWLLAGPVAALTIRTHRRTILPVFVAATLVWNWSYVKIALLPAERTASASYYDSLAAYLHTLPEVLRVEVVPTPTLTETDELAVHIQGIARGWETQIDRQMNAVFYDGTLDASSYHAWLLDRGVSVVALPLDSVRPMSEIEAAVIRSRPAYLEPIWSNADWQVYRVSDATPLADNGATVTDVQPESLTIAAPVAGWSTVKFRFTDMYEVTNGDACVSSTSDGWVRLLVHQPGTIRLSIALSVDSLVSRQRPCG
jgi:hypothetical protein